MSWVRQFGGSSDDRGYDVALAEDDGCVLVGTTSSFEESNGGVICVGTTNPFHIPGSPNICLVKIDPAPPVPTISRWGFLVLLLAPLGLLQRRY